MYIYTHTYNTTKTRSLQAHSSFIGIYISKVETEVRQAPFGSSPRGV